MSRLGVLMQHDWQLQRRYGFWYAAVFVTVVWVVLLNLMPDWTLRLAVPFIVFTDLSVVGFYFLAGMVLFEKGEATLAALVVTPVRFREYLSSKVATLTLLALAVSLVVVLFSYGAAGVNWLLLILSIILMSIIILLVGFISVAPYSSISSYLLPSQLYILVLFLPIIHYFGLWESPVFYAIPSQGALLLLRGAFGGGIAGWQLAYAVWYQLFWIGVLGWVARWAFDRYAVARKGGK